MENGLEARVLAVCEPEIQLLGLTLVDLEILRGGGRLTLRFLVERHDGSRVDVEDCAAASRAVSRAFEAEGEEFVPGRFVIEMSSPGVFQALRKPAHFARACGEMIKLVVAAEEGSSEQLRGRVRGAGKDGIELEVEGAATRSIPFAHIRKAHLDPDLDFGKKERHQSKVSKHRGAAARESQRHD
jgi:ribosome maturation factor RimP